MGNIPTNLLVIFFFHIRPSLLLFYLHISFSLSQSSSHQPVKMRAQLFLPLFVAGILASPTKGPTGTQGHAPSPQPQIKTTHTSKRSHERLNPGDQTKTFKDDLPGGYISTRPLETVNQPGQKDQSGNSLGRRMENGKWVPHPDSTNPNSSRKSKKKDEYQLHLDHIRSCGMYVGRVEKPPKSDQQRKEKTPDEETDDQRYHNLRQGTQPSAERSYPQVSQIYVGTVGSVGKAYDVIDGVWHEVPQEEFMRQDAQRGTHSLLPNHVKKSSTRRKFFWS